MLVACAVSVGFILPTATKAMTSIAATASSNPPGQRLQKLLSVPGSDPRRVNDLLLLRPDAGGQSDPAAKERSHCRHVVFFHGDIQVSGGVWVSRRKHFRDIINKRVAVNVLNVKTRILGHYRLKSKPGNVLMINIQY